MNTCNSNNSSQIPIKSGTTLAKDFSANTDVGVVRGTNKSVNFGKDGMPKTQWYYGGKWQYFKNGTQAAHPNQILVIENVFSGGHFDSNSGSIVYGGSANKKEIPNGSYDILDNKSSTSNPDWFRLDPIDSKRTHAISRLLQGRKLGGVLSR